jgi:hypothetical protein
MAAVVERSRSALVVSDGEAYTLCFPVTAVGLTASLTRVRNHAVSLIYKLGFSPVHIQDGFSFGYQLFGDTAELSYAVRFTGSFREERNDGRHE